MELIGILALMSAFFIFVGLKLYRPRTIVREYRIKVYCLPVCNREDLYELDRDVPEETSIQIITAHGYEHAKDLALDEFHDTVMIADLDDFTIDVLVMEFWPVVDRKRQIEKQIAHSQIKAHIDEKTHR